MSDNELVVPPRSYTLATPTNQAFTAPTAESLLATPHALPAQAHFRKSDIARADVAQAMNSEMFLCEIMKFLDDYSPSGKNVVKPTDIQSCKKYLMDAKVLSKSEVWKDFPIHPSETKKTENDAYDKFASLVTSIWDFAQLKRKKKNEYKIKMVPANHLTSDTGGTNHRMDACTIEEEYTHKLRQDNIIMPVEIKNVYSFKNKKDVREQIVGDCHHILCDDPRRMFIYGITIVDERMSIWYFSRTHSVKALAFDWIKDIDTFIHVMLAFAFATPMDLGIDPFVHKVKRVSQENDQHFVYEFKDPTPNVRETRASISNPRKIYYKTVQARSFMRPYCLSGRITRIWEVIQVNSIADLTPAEGAVPVIVKDVWLDAETKTEGENQEDVFKAVDKFVAEGLKAHSGPGAMMSFMDSEPRFAEFDAATRIRLAGFLTGQRYKELFLTKILESIGETSKKLSEHVSRPVTPLFPMTDETGAAGGASRTKQGSYFEQATVKPSVPIQDPDIVSKRRYDPRRQVRFVYKEVCQDLEQIRNLGDALDILRQALDALQILYCAGWVHRDVSMGNILAHRVEGSPNGPIWKVKLSDLEFAQPLGSPKHRTDPRTGTPYYMAVEIMNKRYLVDKIRKMMTRFPEDMAPGGLVLRLAIDPTHNNYQHYYQFKKFGSITAIPHDASPGLPLKNDPVLHNYQHDLESIWWIMLYLVTSRTGHAPAEKFVDGLFVQDTFASRQREFLLSSSLDIYSEIHPDIADTFPELLEALREAMYESYVARAIFGHLLVHKSYSAIYAKFVTQIDAALLNNHGNWRGFNLAKRDHPKHARQSPTAVGSKRQLSNDEDVSNKRPKA